MKGNSSTRDELIEGYHYLCARAARKFMRNGLDRNDLIQVAAIGLIKAADRFEQELGTPFEAFAWLYILGELMHYVRDHERMLRAPRRTRDLARRWSSMEVELRAQRGVEPSESEIASALGFAAEDVIDVRRYRGSAHVLSVENLRIYDHSAFSYTIEAQADRVAIAHGLATLSPLERRLIHEIYENDTPLVEIANILGYSRRHVTRMHRSVLKKLAPFACHHAM